ncbi:unnamed protein product, partial [Scytosiphon promiscuus]
MEGSVNGGTTDSAVDGGAPTDEDKQEAGEGDHGDQEGATSCEDRDLEEEPAGAGRGPGTAAPSPAFRTSKGKGKMRASSGDGGGSGGSGGGIVENSPGQGVAAAGAGSRGDRGEGILDSSAGTGGGEVGGEGPGVDAHGEKKEEKKKEEEEKKKKKKKKFKCVICLGENEEKYLKTPCCFAIAHPRCLQDWISTKSECMQCHKRVSTRRKIDQYLRNIVTPDLDAESEDEEPDRVIQPAGALGQEYKARMKQIDQARKKRLEEEERRNLEAAMALAADEGAGASANGPAPPSLTAEQIAEQTRLLSLTQATSGDMECARRIQDEEKARAEEQRENEKKSEQAARELQAVYEKEAAAAESMDAPIARSKRPRARSVGGGGRSSGGGGSGG